MCGSSPRTWGTLEVLHVHSHGVRFIPTHVGNTQSACDGRLVMTVHPHARGEHQVQRHGAAVDVGSSPRTWGTRRPGGGQRHQGRFIPTHVGNTCSMKSCPPAKSVHPHARGEHHPQQDAEEHSGGSSPRTWGTRRRPEGPDAAWRFIPTHVGNTPLQTAWRWATSVHPHARGEHTLASTLASRAGGSSPRTWGTRCHLAPGNGPGRFIPTHVGNTRRERGQRTVLPVHPHARGEHLASVTTSASESGSSPRTWGTLMTQYEREEKQRFIPTHVGNTHRQLRRPAAKTVHPHARGEHSTVDVPLRIAAGSSPRTWGTRTKDSR